MLIMASILHLGKSGIPKKVMCSSLFQFKTSFSLNIKHFKDDWHTIVSVSMINFHVLLIVNVIFVAIFLHNSHRNVLCLFVGA